MTGEMLGHYEIKYPLGSGGIGHVFAALDKEVGRMVAIKSLRPELTNDATFLERFLGEANSQGRLNHPNITTLYTLYREGKIPHMIMELVPGSTLEEILTHSPRLEMSECLAVIAQTSVGLAGC